MENLENNNIQVASSEPEEINPIIEAVLFAAGYPVPYEKISEITGIPVESVKDAVAGLSDLYIAGGRGIQIVLYDESCQMCTREEYEQYIRVALGIKQGGRLSNSSLEVLAIIAYRQPVTKTQIEHIRGVDSSYAITSLSAKGLIEVKGKLDVPGKPNLYGTTTDFLRCFGLSSLGDLPDAESFLIDAQVNIDELDEISQTQSPSREEMIFE